MSHCLSIAFLRYFGMYKVFATFCEETTEKKCTNKRTNMIESSPEVRALHCCLKNIFCLHLSLYLYLPLHQLSDVVLRRPQQEQFWDSRLPFVVALYCGSAQMHFYLISSTTQYLSIYINSFFLQPKKGIKEKAQPLQDPWMPIWAQQSYWLM